MAVPLQMEDGYALAPDHPGPGLDFDLAALEGPRVD
jgi:hypothetical protein